VIEEDLVRTLAAHPRASPWVSANLTPGLRRARKPYN
jgi:hypothetical protein